MSRIVTHAIRLTVVLLLVCGLFGCATSRGHRIYSGPPRPNAEVALVYDIAGCTILDIREVNEKDRKKFLFISRKSAHAVLELLPGQYIAGISYGKSSGTYGFTPITTTSGGKLDVNLNVSAGNVYIIYPEMNESKTTWRPVYDNIKDYTKEKCSESVKCAWGCECPDKDIIVKLATEYLQSERLIMTYHPSRFVDVQGKPLDVGDYWD